MARPGPFNRKNVAPGVGLSAGALPRLTFAEARTKVSSVEFPPSVSPRSPMNRFFLSILVTVLAAFSLPAPCQEPGKAEQKEEPRKEEPRKEEPKDPVARPKPGEGDAPPKPAADPKPAAVREVPGEPHESLTPKQQITGFYAMCKQNRGGEGLQEMLSTNPVVQSTDIQRVAQVFEEMIVKMGEFRDFKILKETPLSDRIVVVRCVAHFEKQPFINEFTFYNSSAQDWRLVYLKYDANLATMFVQDLMGK